MYIISAMKITLNPIIRLIMPPVKAGNKK